MKFVIPFFNHQNGKVRNVASSLVAEVSVEIGFNNDIFNDYIKDLNPQILNIIKMKSKKLNSEKNNSIHDDSKNKGKRESINISHDISKYQEEMKKYQEEMKNYKEEINNEKDNEASSILNYSYYQNVHSNESIINDYEELTEDLSKIHEKAKNDEIYNVNRSFSSKLINDTSSYLETSVNNYSEIKGTEDASNIENSESYLETLNKNHICIFCEERNEKFNEKTLDQHYRKECPMLINCYRCHLIVEVSNLSNHLYNDCEFKSDYRKCDKCNLAIRYDEKSKHYKYHSKHKQEDQRINGYKPIHCQLCNEIINSKFSMYYSKLDKRSRNYNNNLAILENKMWKNHMLICKNNSRNKIKKNI
eukprot:jgi/Orpsp1_1/1177633/evm.model.c7180000062232.2